ncbi:MAG: ribonuclease Y [Algisphaera sp.]
MTLLNTLLADIAGPTALLIAAVTGIGSFVAAWFMGRGGANGAVTHAKRESETLLTQAKGEASTLIKQAELDAQTSQVKRREAFDKETETSRNGLAEKERRLTKREDNLDKKLDVLTTKEKHLQDVDSKLQKTQETIAQKETEAEEILSNRRREADQHAERMKAELQRVSHLNEEDAKREMMSLLEQQLTHESGALVRQVTERAEEEAKEIAQKITLTAIQRYASEHTAESTTNSVKIEDEAMKGRVIGREGRNIRAFEQATGVDVVVDDTPGVIIVSCFDPVRRATASETLRRLLEDGRIHPARIEELFTQVGEEMDKKIVKYGKDACIEANIRGLHPKISEQMGRLHYRTSYGQNILQHSHEVAYLCQVIADELGLDGELARRCGFLHDIGKAMDHDVEGGHPQIGADFCRKFGENEAVLNAIAGHHNDIPATTAYTPIVMAADAISGARTGARRESLERYVKRLKDLEQIARDQRGVKEAFAIQAGREVRVIVDPHNISDNDCHAIARHIAKRVSEEMTFPGEIKVSVLREMRTIEFAK